MNCLNLIFETLKETFFGYWQYHDFKAYTLGDKTSLVEILALFVQVRTKCLSLIFFVNLLFSHLIFILPSYHSLCRQAVHLLI